MSFLTFGDYTKIILADANWTEVFQPVLGDRVQFETRMRRLTALRNDVAHSRPLLTGERAELRTLADRVLSQ